MQKNQIYLVEQKRLHEFWPFVKKGLTSVIQKTKPEWLAEDIYSAIRGGNAFLLIAFTNNRPCAFSVFYYADIPFTAKREQFIWVTFTIQLRERQVDDDISGAVRLAWNFMTEHGRQQSASRQTCISPRKGFAKWAKQFGLEQSLVTYVAPL